MFKSKVSSLCNQDDRKAAEEFLLCWISNEPHGCVVIRKNLSQKAIVCVCVFVPHLLCVCGGGDGGGAGAGGHPVVLPFAIWLLVGTQRVHVSIAAEHVAQSLQRLRTTAAKTKTARGRSFKFHHRTTSCCIQHDSHRITKVADKLFVTSWQPQMGDESRFHIHHLSLSCPWTRHSNPSCCSEAAKRTTRTERLAVLRVWKCNWMNKYVWKRLSVSSQTSSSIKDLSQKEHCVFSYRFRRKLQLLFLCPT